jgi:hypothetical protein
MKTIKTSKLIEQENIASSITVSPCSNFYVAEYFLKSKTPKGKGMVKKFIFDKIIEDVDIPDVGNHTVKHLGYKTYQHFKSKSGFYINFYKN